jgi:16S rRNA (cytosine967-C5)-methyltransferase
MANTRAIACQIIHDIVQKKTSLIHLEQLLASYSKDSQGLNPNDKAFVQALCYGVCRQYYLLKAIIEPHIKKKPKEIVLHLLFIGLYQLKFMNQPGYATIHETVSACKPLKIEWAKGLINALLRKLSGLPLDESKYLAETRYAFPNWLFQRIRKAYPEQWRDILIQSNEHAPMFLRINETIVSTSSYLDLLSQHNILASRVPLIQNCLQLETPTGVDQLPNFENGWCSVQDYSAQFAAQILAPLAQKNLLDACAAPGGKTIALLEQNPNIQITAIDNNQKRLDKITQNVQRIFPETTRLDLICDHAENIKHWSDGTKFNTILLDAPCSATGVIRRHPDIKILRTEAEVKSITSIQKILLGKLWSLLEVDGYLLYATCSLLPEENIEQIKTFLESHENATEVGIEILQQYKVSHGYQLLPKIGDCFYYCMLQKSKVVYTESKDISGLI